MNPVLLGLFFALLHTSNHCAAFTSHHKTKFSQTIQQNHLPFQQASVFSAGKNVAPTFLASSYLSNTLRSKRRLSVVPPSPTDAQDRSTNTKKTAINALVTGSSIQAITKSFNPLFQSLNTKLITNNIRTYILLFIGALTTWRIRLLQKMNKVTTTATDSSGSVIESGWAKRGYSGSFRRTIEVWTFAISFLFQFFKNKRLEKKDPEAFKEGSKVLAKLLTEKILALGPTFIKLGQLLSTRIDVLPKEFINELVRLQDQVPGFSGDMAVRIIESELGAPIDQLFDSFNRTSIAAASLGQVHVAYKNGQKLAVKVQRQGLKELFDMDLKNIKVLAKLLDKFDPKSDGAQRDWASIYDESQRLLYKEIDYRAEAFNSIRFKDNFKDIPWVKVPEVFLNMTTSRVVTMEFVQGIKINDIEKIEAAGIDRQLLAKRSAESYLSQICRHGYFHCDPHPGNVACDNVDGGRLIYYDFGMMDELKPMVKKGLVDLIFGIYEGDVKEVCDALETIGILRTGVDRISVEKIARVFLQEFSKGISGDQWVSQLPAEQQAEIRRKRRLQLGADLFTVGSDVPFRFPPTFTFVFRAFTSLDGIGKGLDPKYDLTRLAQPFLQELVDLRDGSATVSLLKTWAKKLGWRPIDIQNAISQPRKVAQMSEMMTKMEQGDLKIRVRVLESERAFKKMELLTQNLASALGSVLSLNVGMVLWMWMKQQQQQLVSASSLMMFKANPSLWSWPSLMMRASFLLAAYFGLQIPVGFLKVKALEKKFASFEKE